MSEQRFTDTQIANFLGYVPDGCGFLTPAILDLRDSRAEVARLRAALSACDREATVWREAVDGAVSPVFAEPEVVTLIELGEKHSRAINAAASAPTARPASR